MISISILGCGWLGLPLAENLISKGYSVKGSSTSEHKLPSFKKLGINPFTIEINNIASNITDFLDSEVLLIMITSTNIESFKNLITEIEKSRIKKVLFVSSTSVYTNSTEPVTENGNLSNSPLIEIEQLFTNNSNFETTIIRFAGLFGYTRKPGNFFKYKKAIPNPTGFVNMIHRDDCIKIIEQVITQNCWDQTFNACADSHPTRKEFYTKAAIDMGKEIPEFEDEKGSDFKIIDNSKLKKVLNYTFKHPDLLKMDLG